MPTNFLDPYQVEKFKQVNITNGKSPAQVDAYVNRQIKQQMASTQLGLDVGKQEVEMYKLNKEMRDINSGKADLGETGKEKQRFASLSRNTLNQMKSIYGMGDANNVGTGSDLSEGEGILGRLGRKSEDLIAGITGKSNDKRDAAKEFNDLAQMLVGQLSQAFGSGTPQEGEAKRLIESMPTRNSNDATAAAWFRNVDNLLAQSAGEAPSQAPGMGLNQEMPYDAPQGTSPALNLKGEVAQYGDVIFNESKGQLETYGKPSEDTVFKKTPEGSNIDNSFIKFLADSEFLPIVGSIAGGMAGAGLLSIGTGAAGAVAGKAMQQGIRELFDPEQQELSDMAKAVVVEGATDAILGGMFFGVGSVAGKGLKMVFSNAPGMAKAGLEVASEGAEVAGKSATQNVSEGLIQKGLGITPTMAKKGSQSIKGDIVEEITNRGYKSLKDAAVTSEKELTGAVGQLNDLLAQSGDVKTADVIKVLQDAQYSVTGPAGDVLPTAKTGTDQIQDWIKYAMGFGDEMSLKDVNKIKQGLQEAFPKGTTQVTKKAKEVVIDASSMVREFIEKEGVEGIAGTNREIQIAGFVHDAAIDKLNSKKFKFVADFVDLAMGISNPALLIGKKGVELFASQFDEVAQARLLQTGLDNAVASGNRAGVRNMLRFAQRLGITFSANAISPDVADSQVSQPGLDLQPQPVTTPPGLGLAQGGGSQHYLYR